MRGFNWQPSYASTGNPSRDRAASREPVALPIFPGPYRGMPL